MRTPSIVFIVSAAAAVFLSGCGHSPELTRAESNKAPVPVRVEAVATSESPTLYEASGTVRARTAAQISSRVMAYVREVRAQVGDRVREGQVLAVLDARDSDVRKRQADAGREEAHSAAREAEQGYASAKANLELADATFNRMKDLFDKKSISRQEFDEATARVKMARAGLEMAAAKRAQVAAKIRQADEDVAGASILQDYSTITAPFSGVITEKNVEPGNLAVPGQPLMTLERGGGYRLEANVEESMMGRIRLRQNVQIALDAVAKDLSGRVSEIVPAVDPTARTSTVKIDLPPLAELRTGLFGRARFEIGSRKALTVPSGAISNRGEVQWVFAAENGKAHSRIITTGERAGDRIEVLSGLSDGDKLIVPVPVGLADGDRIEVKP
jgi:RND family efflux transporter MFP subunit